MQIALDFTATRARATDPETSRKAAKNAVTNAASAMRLLILNSLREHGPQTPKEIAKRHGVDFVVLSRRMSEVAYIETTGETRDGSREWRAMPWKAN